MDWRWKRISKMKAYRGIIALVPPLVALPRATHLLYPIHDAYNFTTQKQTDKKLSREYFTLKSLKYTFKKIISLHFGLFKNLECLIYIWSFQRRGGFGEGGGVCQVVTWFFTVCNTPQSVRSTNPNQIVNKKFKWFSLFAWTGLMYYSEIRLQPFQFSLLNRHLLIYSENIGIIVVSVF